MTQRSYRPGEINELYGITAERIAEWIGCHVTTARRYKRGEEPSKAALELIRLRSTGDLGVVDPEWTGWRLIKGELVSPEGMQFTTGEVRAGPYWRRLAQSYQQRSKLPQQADWVQGEWTPAREVVEA